MVGNDFESIVLVKMSRTNVFSRLENGNQYRFDDKSSASNRFNLETIFDFSNLQPRVQTHLKNVYTCVLVSVICATLGVYLSMTDWFNYPRLAIFASIITTIRVDPQIVMTAFLLTTTMFACLTLSALVTRKRTYLYLGGILGTGTSIMLLLSLMNIFGRSQLIFNINLHFGLVIVCGYILYDTQLIVERTSNGDMNYVKHAILLFIDMVDLFVRILIILFENSQSKNKKSNNR
ncbi:unnamed protein product [Rotaria magnacalcarata]|uniref:Uncharacterized protein n=4 Tax=Rotaria magnacalcarata TaxID=392030 RepID=A0A816N6P0_9BILA|nr:unnamed protein product [Rotaria magnacalcarata]